MSFVKNLLGENLGDSLAAIGATALDSLSPPSCLGCNAGLDETRRAQPFCTSCELGVAPRDPESCPTCDQPAKPNGLCRSCARDLAPLQRVGATFDYEGPIAAAIQRLKYEGRDEIAKPLARRWVSEWGTTGIGLRAPLVIPVPLHRRRLASRGFDQAWLLAQEVGRLMGAEAAARGLHRQRATPPQVGLGRDARAANVRRAFSAETWIAGRDILLVDDVLTTGSTLRACAEALAEAGAASVSAVAVARAQP